jgi:hypothetical protein
MLVLWPGVFLRKGVKVRENIRLIPVHNACTRLIEMLWPNAAKAHCTFYSKKRRRALGGCAEPAPVPLVKLCDPQYFLPTLWRSIILLLRGDVLGDQFGLKPAY